MLFRVSFSCLYMQKMEFLNEQGRIIMVSGEETILPWSVRLKIGKGNTNAVTYFTRQKRILGSEAFDSTMECWRRKKKNKKEKARNWFLRNGSMFLEQLIADCNGLSNPFRMFSSDQISKGTNHFDPCSLIGNSETFTFYKSVMEGRSYMIKRFTEPWREDEPYNDIVLSARVSSYIGFPKFMGCCLDFPTPVVVFEDLECRFLNRRGSIGREDAPLLPWNVRLKIAKEVATAIAYLHSAFPRVIIHRDITPRNVLLDKNGTAKLTGLSLSVTLPEGKSWIEETVVGRHGYTDPIYSMTGILTTSSDVFSFGILMLVLLMGRQPFMAGSDGVLDPNRLMLDYVRDLRERGEPVEFGGDSIDMRLGQMKMFFELALRCCKKRNEDRPNMILVAKEIKLIEKGKLDCSEDGQI